MLNWIGFTVFFLGLASLTKGQGQYLGCFEENARSRTFATSAGTYDPSNVNPTICSDACARWEYFYAALTEGRFCLCSNRLPPVTPSWSGNCSYPCSAPAGTATCGGKGYVDVYQTPLQLRGLIITASPANGLIPVGGNVTFTISMVTGPLMIKYSVDFDDGSTPTVANTTMVYTKTFIQAGQYVVTATADDALSTKASVVINVQAPAQSLGIHCPPLAATYEKLECNATLQIGTYPSITLDYGDGTVEAFSIADTPMFSAGPAVTQHDLPTPGGQTTAGNTYVLPGSEFLRDGTAVVAFEMYVSFPGTFTFAILQPSCAVNPYCDGSSTCSATCLGYRQAQCGGATPLFCPRTDTCVANSPFPMTPTNCSAPTARPAIGSYVVSKVFTYGTTTTGYQVYNIPLSDGLTTITVGSVIAVYAAVGDGRLQTRPMVGLETQDISIAAGITLGGTLSGGTPQAGQRVMLRAVAVKQSSVVLHHMYTLPGVYVVSANVNNDYVSPVIPVLNDTTVVIEIGINVSIVDIPPFWKTGQAVRAILEPHTGSNITYLWTTGDSGYFTTFVPYIDHTYATRGCYAVNNTAYNQISRKSSNLTDICIEDEILNMTVINNVTPTGALTPFLLSMSSGSDYVCTWNFGDGGVGTSDWWMSSVGTCNVTHQYSVDGTYNVTVSCHNNVSASTYSFLQYVQYPITNLQLVKNGALEQIAFYLDFSVTQATAPTFILTYDGAQLTVNYDPVTKTGKLASPLTEPVSIHNVTLRGYNQISDVTISVMFTVERPIANALATSSVTVTITDLAMTVTASCTDGSSVRIFIDYMDGTNNDSYAMQPATIVPAGGLSQPFNHVFLYGSQYNISVTIENSYQSFYFTLPVLVYGKIANITLVAQRTGIPMVYGVGQGVFWFESPVPPFGCIVQFDWGFGNWSQWMPFAVGQYYYNDYYTEGTYNVQANISNPYSWGLTYITVTLAEAILNMMLIPDTPQASVGVAFVMGVAMDGGSHVMLHYDFGDPTGPASNLQTFPRTGLNAYQLDKASHVYTMVGTYLITVTATNILGNTTMTYLVVVQQPVTNYFQLSSTAPVPFPDGTVTYTLSYTGPAPMPPLPTNATIVINYGDGNVSAPIPVPFSGSGPYTPVTFTYQYKTDGAYTTSFNISNLASSGVFTTKSGAYAPLSSLGVTAMWQPLLPVGGPALSGFGANNDTFPVGQPILFYPKVNGTVDTYLIQIYNSTGALVTQYNPTTAPFPVDITKAGSYQIKVTVSNPLSGSLTYSYNMNVNHTVTGAQLSVNPLSGPVTTPITVTATFQDLSSETCVVIWFGDGTQVCYGPTTCPTHPSCVTYMGIAWARTMGIPHQYTKNGLYKITMSASDLMGNQTSETFVTISSDACTVPNIQIIDAKPLFYEPLDVPRSERFEVVSITQIACAKSLNNSKYWTVEQLNPSTGDVIARITAADQLDTIHNAAVSFPERFFQYGTYRLTYNVTMIYEPFFSAKTVTHIRIVQSPLIARLAPYGMSTIIRGYDTIVLLEPYKYSQDPDLDPSLDQGFTKIEIFCRQHDEKFALNYDGSLSTSNPSMVFSSDMYRQGLITMNDGGCFRQGPGPVVMTSTSLEFTTLNQVENGSYVFHMIIHKGDRNATAELQMNIIPGDPVDVVMGCFDPALCTPTTSGIDEINPTSRMSVFSHCVPNACPAGSTYKWEVYRLGLNGAWLPIDTLFNYAAGIYSPDIAVSAQLFQDGFTLYKNLINYQFRISVYDMNGVLIGESSKDFIVNLTPKNGDCQLSSTAAGTSFYTKYNIWCNNWNDTNGMGKYLLYYTTADKPGVQTLLAQSDTGYFDGINLPQGSPLDGYKVGLSVWIYDSNGAYNVYTLPTVQISPLTPAEAQALVDQLLGNKTIANEMLLKASEGDLGQSVINFQTLADVLDQAKIYAESSCTAPDTYPCGNLTTNYAYQQARDQRSVLRTQMMQALANETICNIDDAQLLFGAVETLTNSPTELGRDGQLSAINMLDKTMQLLNSTRNDFTIEQYINALQHYVEIAGNLMKDVSLPGCRAAAYLMGSFGPGYPPINRDEESGICRDTIKHSAVNYGIGDGTITDILESKKTHWYEYDTDWESTREGFEGSMSDMRHGLQLETNSLNQKDQSKYMIGNVMDQLKVMAQILIAKQVAGEPPINITTPSMTLYVDKDLPSAILAQPITTYDGAQVAFPKEWCKVVPFDVNCANPDPVSIVMTTTPDNTFQYFKDADKVSPYSSVVSLDFYDNQGNPINVINTAAPIEITIPKGPDFKPAKPEIQIAVMSSKVEDNSTMFFYNINVTTADASIHIEIFPADENVQYLVLLRYQTFPQISGANKGWDYLRLLPDDTRTAAQSLNPNTVILNNTVVKNRLGLWYLGIRQLNQTEHNIYNDLNTPAPPPDGTGRFTSNYSLTMYTGGCYYSQNTSEKGSQQWMSDGCTVSQKSTQSKTVCECTHLTVFGSGFMIKPNKIDFDFILKNSSFAKNPTLYVTMIVIGVIYILLAIWARYRDKRDVKKIGVTPLPDNDPRDKYLYEIFVSTGIRKNAATDSKVHIILSGEFDETDVRVLEDDQRKVFRRGADDSFLMAVPRPLGSLSYIRIWHDNSGKGKFASWYLNWLGVRDLQTGQRFYFISNQWFAVEEDDGLINRVIPVAGKEQLTDTGHLFGKKATRGLGDDHIWFSVVSNTVHNRFTRLQRLSCCLCLLFTAMFANAMFYGVLPSNPTSGLNIGPFTLTPEQIYVGIISNLIVFPINFLIAFLFKKSRPHYKRPSRIDEAIKKMKERQSQQMVARGDGMEGVPPLQADSPTFGNDRKPILADNHWGDQGFTGPLAPAQSLRHGQDGAQATAETGAAAAQPVLKKKKRLSLPWWCRIVAWVLLWLTVAGSVAGVTFYGIMFQDDKARKWISSMLISFVTSVFISQPIKVVLLALLFALIFKKPDLEEYDEEYEDEEEPSLRSDELWVHSGVTGPMKPRTLAYEPPDPAALARAREKRLKEIQMFEILREITLYAFYLWVMLVISYEFRDPNAFLIKQNIESMFVNNQPNALPNNSLDRIRTMDDFFGWAEGTFAVSQRADNWYNDWRPVGLRGYLNDYVSRIMGYATMRQLRIKKDKCKVAKKVRGYVRDCNIGFNLQDEDKASYGVGWTQLSTLPNGSLATPQNEYKYTSSDDMDGYPFWSKHHMYPGGGYVVELSGDRQTIINKILAVKQDGWVDRYTRAVFFEFAVYNVMVNMFASVTLVAELLESGGFDCFYHVEPMNLLGSRTGAAAFILACQIIFVIFTAVFIVREARNLYKQRCSYFKQFWNLVEIWIIAFSLASIAVFAYRRIRANQLTKIFKKSGGNAFMNFQSVAYWNNTLLLMIGFIVFWSTIKFIKLLRFNKVMGILGSTLKYASKPLIHFTLVFAIVFFAFLHFFYLIFLSLLEDFSSVVLAAEMMMQMMVGKFNFNEIVSASPVLGTLMFFVYMVVVFFILLTMFVTIINEAFAEVCDDVSKQSNEHEMVDFILQRFMRWSGMNQLIASLRKKNGGKLSPEAEKQLLEAQLANFPHSMDRFLDYVSQTYFQKENFDSIFSDPASSGGKGAMKGVMSDSTGKPAIVANMSGKQTLSAMAKKSQAAPRSPFPERSMPPPERQLTDVD